MQVKSNACGRLSKSNPWSQHRAADSHLEKSRSRAAAILLGASAHGNSVEAVAVFIFVRITALYGKSCQSSLLDQSARFGIPLRTDACALVKRTRRVYVPSYRARRFWRMSDSSLQGLAHGDFASAHRPQD
jgi:hypothetical protein